mmetsp:Transcript_21874/g.67919  ORF Transcript_21874/g.67919 Transcript_21874/m.67919 type:complete len:243 (+) Transcript_21874:36-764(+)
MSIVASVCPTCTPKTRTSAERDGWVLLWCCCHSRTMRWATASSVAAPRSPASVNVNGIRFCATRSLIANTAPNPPRPSSRGCCGCSVTEPGNESGVMTGALRCRGGHLDEPPLPPKCAIASMTAAAPAAGDEAKGRWAGTAPGPCGVVAFMSSQSDGPVPGVGAAAASHVGLDATNSRGGGARPPASGVTIISIWEISGKHNERQKNQGDRRPRAASACVLRRTRRQRVLCTGVSRCEKVYG